MGKNTFGKTMPRALSQNLKIMGEQIMLARKRRHLSMQDIADRATVTRLTVSKVEHGDPTVSMGIYARVLFALNLEKDITLLAADDALGRQLQDAELLRNGWSSESHEARFNGRVVKDEDKVKCEARFNGRVVKDEDKVK